MRKFKIIYFGITFLVFLFANTYVSAADTVTQIPQPAPIVPADVKASAAIANSAAQLNPQAGLQQKMELLQKVMQKTEEKQQAQNFPVSGAAAQKQVSSGAISAAITAAPATSTKAGMYDDAFSGMVNQLLPMTPEQIAKLREIFNENQKAAVTPAGVPPRPATTLLMVDLTPSATPPVIRLGAGYITSLVFLDSTGQPWPIEAFSIGDPSAFNIQWDKKGNTLLVQAMSYYKRSNMAVILRGSNTPVMLTFLSGQEAVDYRVDLRVPGMGPNALFVQSGLPESANPLLLDVLNGIPPKGSRTLRVVGGDAQAWLLDKKLYVRTSLDIISPAWKSFMGSVDGTHAYELQVAPVILALQHGKDKTMILTVEGFE